MEDLVSMCERRCRKACNLRSTAEDSEEACHSGSSGGRARRYRKRGSPKPAAGDAGAMDTDPSPVRLWESEGHSDGYRTCIPSESEETPAPTARAHTAPEPALKHDAEGLERPARARTAPVPRHTGQEMDAVGDTPMGDESEAPGTAGCAGSGGKQAECHCEHVSFLMGKYPKMGMDAIVHRLDSLDNAKDSLEEDVAGILDDQSAAEKDMEELRVERDRYRENLELALEKQQRVVDSLLHLVDDMSGHLKRLEELQPLASGPELPAKPAAAELVERVKTLRSAMDKPMGGPAEAPYAPPRVDPGALPFVPMFSESTMLGEHTASAGSMREGHVTTDPRSLTVQMSHAAQDLPPTTTTPKSEVAHKCPNWLPHPCRIGEPHRCRAGGKIRSGPQVGKVATSPLPYRGAPPLQSGGQNQKWPTCGQIGYLTPAVSGSPTAAERGAKSEVAHKWANWLPHPCRIGEPHRCRAGGKIRSGPQVGKLATSPLPYRGAPPLQSGGQNQKWPTSGQIGYLTPAVSGSPTASERGAKSEVAHKWANWLPHPCRIGEPHRCRAGGKIRSGPQVGKLATSPLPYRGAPPLQSGGQNQKWPTSGQIGYLTPAVSGSPTASERGAKSEVAHKWANWLPHPCRIGEPHRCRAGGKIRSGPQVGKLATSPLPYRGAPPLQSGGQNQKWPTSGQIGYLTPAVSGSPTASERGAKSEVAHKWANWLPHPCRIGEPHRFRAGGKIRSGPQVGKLATSPLPYRGAPPLQSGGQNQKWPTSGQIGYLTPAVSGSPTAAERGAKSEVAHKWAKWLPHPCRIGEPHRCRAGGKIRSGPQVGKLATSPLPYRGAPPLQSGGQNQKWPTSGQIGYLTPAVSGSPTAAERGAKSEVAHKWANWLPHPCRIGEPHRCRAGGKIRSGPQVGKLATSPLPYRGAPPLQSGGQNQKWPTSGQIGYLTPAVSGSPTAAERGAKSEVAHKWANWLPHPCRIGEPHRCRAGGKIRSGPQVGKLATSPLPYRGAPPLQSGGQNQKWPTSGQIGYLTPAVSGSPTAAERGAKSEVAHKWANWLPHPCRIGEPHRCRAGGKIRSGPQVGKLATSPLPYRGAPPLQSGGQNQKWPTSGQIGYLTPAVSGSPTASERGAKSEVAHKWANWLPHPCRIGEPHRFRAGGKIRSGPQVGKLATSPLPYRGAPPLQSGGQNQKWPTSGQIGYLTPAVSGSPTAAERGAKSEVAHKWANWLPHPCRIGEPHRCRAGGKIRSGPQVGKLATSPLPYRGAPPLQSGGQNQKWPTSGQIGYLTPAVSGSPTASERGAKSEVAHKWANWLPHPCRIGEPHRCRAGGKIRSGPQVGKLATSPLPYRGAPPLQSGGQNQKWPTSGQIGYLTPAVSGSPTAAERGAKSEVAHKWANWLPHPCRIGEPHRCRAGGKIRSGPQVGKLATSPLPYRGAPPLQSGGQNQKWCNVPRLDVNPEIPNPSGGTAEQLRNHS